MKTLFYILLFLVTPQITTAQVGVGDSCVLHSDELYSYASITIPRDAHNICEAA